MIVYGTFTETSVAKLFMAGVMPGLLLTGDVHGLHRRARLAAGRSVAPVETRRRSPRRRIGSSAVLDVMPFVVLIGGTMGSIYSGLVTPTEAAAVGCLLAMVIAMFWGEFNFGVLQARAADHGAGLRQHPVHRLCRLRLFLRHQLCRRRRADHAVSGRT